MSESSTAPVQASLDDDYKTAPIRNGKVWTAIAGLAVFVAILASVYGFVLPRLSGEPLSSAARLEIRAADRVNPGNWTESRSASGEVLYLSPEVILTAGDVAAFRASYRSEEDGGSAVMDLVLRESGRNAIGDYSRKNLGKMVVVLVNDKVISSPTITAELSSRITIDLGGLSRDEAEDIFARLTQ